MANRDFVSQRKLVESFVPPPLRLAWASDPSHLSTGTAMAPTALLWLDLVGSTRLARTLIESEGGIDRLGSLFGDYFDLLLKKVVAHGGQPLLFAGDGLLSGWTHQPSERECFLRAAQCAQDVQSCGIIKGLGECSIQLHAVLAHGACKTLELPVDGVPLDVVIGSGLRDLQSATQLRAPGQTVVSANAAQALEPVSELDRASGGRGILRRLHKHVVPKPLFIDPLPESISPKIGAHVQPQIATSLDPYNIDYTPELRRVTTVFTGISGINWSDTDIETHLGAIAKASMPIVRKYDGFFHQLRVDDSGINLMILFGTQLATHADNPVRGVRAAGDLKHVLSELGYQTSLAVTTGPTLCCLMGNDIFRKHMVFGDAINLAARLKQLSQGRILCDESTKNRALDTIAFEPLGDAYVEGIARPVPTCAVRKIGRPRSSLRMVGREAELKKLIDKINGIEPDTRGAAVLLEGESGFGKSLLLDELQRKIPTEVARIVISNASRIEQKQPYHGWTHIYEKLLGINEIDDAGHKREKVKSILESHKDQAWYLNALLPLSFATNDKIAKLSGEQQARERLKLLLFLLRKSAQGLPLVVVIDDAHWLDEASWQLASKSIEEVPGLCLILSMQVSEDQVPCNRMEAQGAMRLRLSGLSDAQQEQLVCSVLGVERVPHEAISLIIDRAAGQPLYCQELARTLRDEGLVEVADGTCHFNVDLDAADVPLPDSISSTVQRRIDRLERVPRVMLKLASVTGMQFPTRLVEHLCSAAGALPVFDAALEVKPREIRKLLKKNCKSGLLRAALVDDMEGYAFSHGIIRDVAYDLIHPLELRNKIHLRIADWYENEYPDEQSRSPFHAFLAYHLEKAGEQRRAASYLLQSAERQFELGMAPESVNTGIRAASLLLTEHDAGRSSSGSEKFDAQLASNPEKIGSLIALEMNRLDSLRGGRQPEELLKLSQIDQKNLDHILKLLTRLAPILYQSGRGDLFALIITTAMRITLEHGNGRMAPVVYSLYSIIAGGAPEIRTKKAAWSQLALDLLGQQRDGRFGKVAFIHSWFHNHWITGVADTEVSLQRSIELSRAGAEAAFADQDIQYAGYNLAACVIYMATAGLDLKYVAKVARDHLQEMEEKGRAITGEFHLKLELQMAKALMGLTRGWLSLTDEEYDQHEDLEWIRETDFDNQIGYYFVSLGKLHAHFGDWRGARTFFDRFEHKDGEEPRLTKAIKGQTADYERVQFAGLAALAEVAFGEAGDDKLVEIGERSIDQLRIWDEQWKNLNAQGSSMYDHKKNLLSGIKACVGQPSEQACGLLKKSAEAASAGGFLNDAVLAYEFLARCHRKVGQSEKASVALNEAIEVCNRWGATAKAVFLQEELGAHNIKLVLSPLSPVEAHEHAYQPQATKEARKA